MAFGNFRPTKLAQQSLDLVRGQGEDLLNDVVAQTGLQNASDLANTGISVVNKFTSGAGLDVGSLIPDIDTDGITAGIESIVSKQGVEALAQSLTPDSPLGSTENLLKSFASYNYNLTFACLTVNELNFPDSTYRVRDPQVTVLRSGGGAPGKAMTAYESETAQLEYFIDDFTVGSVIAPTTETRSSNATSFSFTVHEPYSMGLFLQTLMIAANKAGHQDYLKAPWAMIIDFVGWDDAGNKLALGANVRRVFPLKLANVEFDVNAGGSAYSVEAFAWNEQAQTINTQTIPADEKISGSNLLELLQTGPESLSAILNKRVQENAQDSQAPINKDEIVIMFPKELTSSLGLANIAGTGSAEKPAMTIEEYFISLGQTGTEDDFNELLDQGEEKYQQYLLTTVSNNNIVAAIRRVAENESAVNDIGKSTPVKSMAEGGATPFGKEVFAHDNKTGIYRTDKIQISNEFKTFQFQQGTSIEQIIEELLILSSYGRAAAQAQPDSDGMIPWYRIQTQTFLVPDPAVRRRTGENPKVYVYAVVPYKVHSSVFSNTSQPSVGIKKRKAQAAKTYDYIYTGQNDDILDFEIKFNNSFYKALGSNINGSGDSRNASRDGASNPNNANFDAADGVDAPSYGGDAPVKETHDGLSTGQTGGSDSNSPEVQVARMFNEAIVNNGVDMLTMDITIMGDPYYLADSGVGNYSSPPLAQAYTVDGTMDHQRGEVEVNVNFRTPVDYQNGEIIFPSVDKNVTIGAFSGLYKVITVENSFTGGKFTQVLSLLRRNNQDENEGSGTPDNTSAVAPTESDNTSNTDTANPPTTANTPPPGTGTAPATSGTEPAATAATPAATAAATPTATTRSNVDVWGFQNRT